MDGDSPTLPSIVNGLVFTNAKVTDAIAELNIDISDIVSTNLNDKKPTCEMDNCYVLLTFLLVTMSLLITAIFYYCIKHQTSFGT